MTTKEIAEAAGVSSETVRAKGKELFPDKFVIGKKTVFCQKEAIAIMSEIRKKGFIQPTENLEVPTENLEVGDRFARLERMVESLCGAVAAITSGHIAQKAIEAPKLEPRAELNMIVRKAGKTSEGIRDAWGELHRHAFYRLGINFRQRAETRGLGVLDYVTEEGFIGDYLAIAREIF